MVAGDGEQGRHRRRRDADSAGATGDVITETLSDDPEEAVVRRVLGDALSPGERQRAQVQVLRSPAQHGGVERDHECSRTAVLGACDEVVDQLFICRPVQLEPVSSIFP